MRQVELFVGHSVFTSELQPCPQRRDPTLDKIPAVDGNPIDHALHAQENLDIVKAWQRQAGTSM
jgi:hypothetical protein